MPRVIKMTHGNFFSRPNSSHKRIYIVNIEVIGILLSSYTLFSYDLLKQILCTSAASKQSKPVRQITDERMWFTGRLISDNEVSFHPTKISDGLFWESTWLSQFEPEE